MSEAKHSPGPWICKEGAVYQEASITGQTIATVNDTIDEAVITAAPDLLSALVDLLADHDDLRQSADAAGAAYYGQRLAVAAAREVVIRATN